MKNLDTYRFFIFNYYVFFSEEHLVNDYQPIVHNFDEIRFAQTTHIWDRNLDAIIPALWYILHLPRMGFDVLEMDIELVLRSHDEPHNIIPIPYCKNNIELQNIINRNIVNPTLIICEDKIYDDVANDNTISKSVLNIVKISELSSELLHNHWNKLSNYIHGFDKDIKQCVVENSFRLTTQNERNILPLIPLANQLGYTHQIIEEIKEISLCNNSNMYVLAMRKRIIDTYNAYSNKNLHFKNKTEKVLIENPNFNGVPLVVTMSGIMSHQIKKSGRIKELPDDEKEIINILGLHRALAKNAMYINIDSVSQEMFTELATLEEHCKDAYKINSNFVLRTLRRLGKLMNNKLRQFNIDIINSVSQITVFSDFPVGLAILPGCSAPLCCIKPITYKPLTPLTKAFQYEMGKQNQVYLGEKCKVIIAECIEKTDKIRGVCDRLTDILRKMIKNVNNMELVVEEISSVNEFKCMLKKHHDAKVLLVSAHGKYNVESNMASLVIGKEVWMASDNDIRVPPVVLLSACHVMPRGRGVVCVGDMFIRAGAKAVLGTFIPVDVRRNATLIVRLFVDIIEVRNGWSHMRTLDEIWCHVVCTNAIHEILASSSKLEKWANTKKRNGLFPQAEFKNIDSVGRLRSTHTYEDTIKILHEIADRDGIGKHFDSVIKSNGYFPESLFYQLIGNPENIFIRNDVMKEYHNKYNHLNSIQ